MLLVVFSCSNDDDEIPNLGTLEVKLQLAAGLDDISLEGVPVKIVNTVDNAEKSANTDANAMVVFEDLPVGTYSVTITQSTDEYTLSGAATTVSVMIQETTEQMVEVKAIDPNAGLVIKELYTAGAGDSFVSLFKDQFIEIYNNASETLYADGIYVANLYGNTGSSDTDVPIADILPVGEYVYADFIDQIPGDGDDYPVEPGKSIVIALNAINFKENNANPDQAIDNTDVTLERYSVQWLEDQGRTGNPWFDFDNPDVPNMTNIYIGETGLYLFNTYGTGAILIDKETTFTDEGVVDYVKTEGSDPIKLMKVPADKIIDGVDILENSGSASFKRLPESIDSGFNFLDPDGNKFYTGMSMRRIVDEGATQRFGRTILQDTNNSTVDWEALEAPDKYGYNE
jgi:hypothetical protein